MVIGLALLWCGLNGAGDGAAAAAGRGAVAGKADLFDRAGRTVPAGIAPLVSHWLRFFVRNKRFRMLYLISFPLAAFLTYNIGQLPKGHGSLFVAALGTLPIVTFLGPSRIAVNLYGYTGGAFRRFFLFPTDPAAACAPEATSRCCWADPHWFRRPSRGLSSLPARSTSRDFYP